MARSSETPEGRENKTFCMLPHKQCGVVKIKRNASTFKVLNIRIKLIVSNILEFIPERMKLNLKLVVSYFVRCSDV